MKILILGSGGMAGHIINHYFKNLPDFKVYGAAREKITDDTILFDAGSKESVAEVLNTVKPAIVINAVGVLVKQANADPANAVLINAYLPHLLSQLTAEQNAYTIHLSTDCVFSGHKGKYQVNDVKDAEDFYGRSKGLGELQTDHDLTIRTSIIGPEIKLNGTGLFDWYIKTTGKIGGYNKVFWSGLTTLELCKALVKSIEYKERGLIQLSNNEKISKYELLRSIGTQFGKDVSLIEKQEETIHDKSLISSAPLERYNIPSYEEMIQDMKDFVFANKNIYSNNYPQFFK